MVTRAKKPTPTPDTTTISEAGKEHVPSDYIQLFDKDGNLLWQTNHLKPMPSFGRMTAQEKQFIELLPQILRDMHDAGIDVGKLTLRDSNLAGVALSHADLAGADLSCCNFNNADLRHANLYGCNLADSSFDNTRMTGATVVNANIEDTNLGHTDSRYINGLILLDELNDYYVWAYPRGREKLLRIRAGCRDFTLAEARQHWSANDDGKEPAMSGREEIFAALPLIELMARRMDWAITVEQSEERAEGLSKSQGGPVADPVDVGDEEDEG